MNKDLDRIRKDISDALKTVEARHGLKFKLGTMRYDNVHFKVALEAALLNRDGRNEQEEMDWKKAVAYGRVKMEWRGAEYTDDDGSVFEIIGADMKRTKNCVRIKRVSDGKIFITRPSNIERHMENIVFDSIEQVNPKP